LGKPQDVEMAVLRMTYEGSSGIFVPHGVRLVASMPKRNTPLIYLTWTTIGDRWGDMT